MATINSNSGQSNRPTIARYEIKWLCSDKILYSWSIRENLAKSPKHPNRIGYLGDLTKFSEKIKRNWTGYNSLSKCLKYPGFIFLCPQKLSKKNPRKITKSLNYPNTIPEFFSEFAYVQDFFYVPRTIRGKKTNTLNYPKSIRYFGDVAKISRILYENKKFYNLCFFCKNLAMFNSLL